MHHAPETAPAHAPAKVSDCVRRWVAALPFGQDPTAFQFLRELSTGVKAEVKRHFDFEENHLFAYLETLGDQAQLRGFQNKYSCASMACEPSDVLGTTRSGWFGRGRDLLEDGWQRDAKGAA